MKTLIYSMKGSGASVFTFFLGQNPNSVVFINFNENIIPPYFTIMKDMVVKCNLNNKYNLEHYIRAFKPDKKILFVRNPYDNYLTLKRKSSPSELEILNFKFMELENQFVQREKYDLVIYYEEFILDTLSSIEKIKSSGIFVDESFLLFRRNLSDMMKFNRKTIPQYVTSVLHYNQLKKFDSGNLILSNEKMLYNNSINKVVEPKIKDILNSWCPSLCDHYDNHLNITRHFSEEKQ